MFRELTRKDKELSEKECIELLIKEKRGVLSVLGDEGYPYGMPMNHYYSEADGKLYFHSGMGGHREDALVKNSKVSYCVFDKGEKPDGEWAYTVKSVVIFGEMEICRDREKIEKICTQLSRKFTSDEEYIKEEIELYAHETQLLVLTPLNICGKRVKEA